MPFGLKNAPSEFQNIMNEIFNPFSSHAIVYINDVLIFSQSLDQHRKHLRAFLSTVKLNGLVVSAPKIRLFQTRVRFLGFDIHHGVIKPIDRVILGNPFLYPFTTDNEGITVHPFNQPIKFEFMRSSAPWEIKSLQKASIDMDPVR